MGLVESRAQRKPMSTKEVIGDFTVRAHFMASAFQFLQCKTLNPKPSSNRPKRAGHGPQGSEKRERESSLTRFTTFPLSVRTYIATYIPTYIPTYVHAYMHTCICIYLHISMHTCMHIFLRVCIPTCVHTYVLTYIRTYIHMHTCIYTQCINCVDPASTRHHPAADPTDPVTPDFVLLEVRTRRLRPSFSFVRQALPSGPDATSSWPDIYTFNPATGVQDGIRVEVVDNL